jgi:multiple sugar transport system substrate-binding protein
MFLRIPQRKVVHWSLISIFIYFLPLPFLSGCATATPPPEPVTITFTYFEFDAAFYEPLVEEFNEQYPHITVELRPVPWSVTLGIENTDVLLINPFNAFILWQQGDILDVVPFIEQTDSFDLPDFYPGAVESFSGQGNTWAIPAGVNPKVMYYNQDLFDQFNVPYPESGWTWDDFLNAAVAINHPEERLFGYAVSDDAYHPGYGDAWSFIRQHGGQIVDDLRNPTRATFDDPLTVEALEWYASLYHEYGVAPPPSQVRRSFGVNEDSFYYGIRHGHVGMWIDSLDDRGGLNWPGAEWFMNWQMVPLPRDAQAMTELWVEGYAISAQTAHPQACWQWVNFLSQQMTYRLMPARKSLAESSAYEARVGENVAAVARASMENVMFTYYPGWNHEFGEAIESIFEEAMDKIVKGEATPQEAMDWAQQEIEKRGL